MIEVTVNLSLKTLTGKIVALEFDDLETTIDAVRKKIAYQEGTPVNQHRLIFNGRELIDGKTLRDYKIADKDIIHIVLRLSAG